MFTDTILAQLIDASRTFKKAGGRHTLKTQDVAYCSFDLPGLTIEAQHTQRNAAKRLDLLGVTREMVEGKSVLDLGCHYGAMLFQISNYNIQSGFGIEFDSRKVELANNICHALSIKHIQFVSGDLDSLITESIGMFDVVMALAIEKHVKDQKRLFGLIAGCTRNICLFEGNGGCSIAETEDLLHEAGFLSVRYQGSCRDDIVPANNRRPNFIASKGTF